MTAPRDHDWWCTHCGAPAAYMARGLDPAYALARCERVTPEGYPRSCGVVPAAASRRDALDLIAARKRATATAHHGAHDTRHPNALCDLCLPALRHAQHVKRRHLDRSCELCREASTRLAP